MPFHINGQDLSFQPSLTVGSSVNHGFVSDSQVGTPLMTVMCFYRWLKTSFPLPSHRETQNRERRERVFSFWAFALICLRSDLSLSLINLLIISSSLFFFSFFFQREEESFYLQLRVERDSIDVLMILVHCQRLCNHHVFFFLISTLKLCRFILSPSFQTFCGSGVSRAQPQDLIGSPSVRALAAREKNKI